MQNQRSLNHFNISHITFLAKNKQKRLSLDVISREFKDLYDSPPLQPRFYLIHPQHFPQTYPALRGPQKSSRINLYSLLNRPAFRGWLFLLGLQKKRLYIIDYQYAPKMASADPL